MAAPSLFLLGMPLSGKSTIGHALADRLGLPFMDLDRRLEQREGKTIPDIFRDGGEPLFRALESLVLLEAVHGPPAVVATGGGIVTTPVNRPVLHDTASVYLEVPLPILWHRGKALHDSGQDLGRPLLADDDWPGKLEDLLATRGPLYHQCARWVVAADQSRDNVVAAIVREAGLE